MEVLNHILGSSYHVYILLAAFIMISRDLFEKRSRFRLRLLLFLPYIILPYFGLYDIEFLKLVNYFSAGAQLIMFVLLFALLEFIYKINWRYLLYLAVFVSAAQHAGDSLGKTAYFAIMRNYVNFSVVLYRVLEVAAYAVVYAALFAFTVKIVKKGVRTMYIRNLPLFALCAIMLVAITILTYLTFDYGLDSHFIIMRAFAFLCNVLVIFLQFTLFQKSEREIRAEMMDELVLAQRAQGEMNRETVNLINIKCHDLKHQIAALRNAGDSAVRDKSIAEIEKSVMIYDSFVKTGNEAIDVVLTQKNIYAESCGVKFSCMIDGGALAFMDDADIWALFGNIADNAINAAAKCGEDKRVIVIEAGLRNAIPYIHQSNFFTGEINFSEGLPVTSRDKKYHGFGMYSIKLTAEKYGGNLTVHAHGEVFELNIIFPSQS